MNKPTPKPNPNAHGFELSRKKIDAARTGSWVSTNGGLKIARVCLLCNRRYTGPLIEHLKGCGK